jgi:hypothetical protein
MMPDGAHENVVAKRGDILLVVGKGERETKSSPVRDVYVIHQGTRCRVSVMFIKPVEEK